jgi:hypothetical protein
MGCRDVISKNASCRFNNFDISGDDDLVSARNMNSPSFCLVVMA